MQVVATLCVDFSSRALVRHAAIFMACLALLSVDPALAGQDPPERQFFDLTIEELMTLKVTSVPKKELTSQQSAAAILVITQEDIARSGLTSLPEVLRLAAGMEVARIDSHTWAISARGFNGQFSDKLLVLVDGRTIHQASFPGVFWDAQDLILEDIDRIEVIRGPGATLWGTNAVNGVVNIITRHSRDTQGAVLSFAAGTEERPVTGMRYGGAAGQRLTYRFYGKALDRDGLVDSSRSATPDRWNSLRGGLRLDWEPTASDNVSVQADYHSDQFRVAHLVDGAETFRDENANGSHVLGRWRRRFAATSELSVQGFYARSASHLTRGRVDDDMADIEVQHRFAAGSRHDILWGGGYRHRSSFFPPEGRAIEWSRDTFTTNLFTGFLQDEITIAPRLDAVVGSKFEHNSYSGASWQPSVRILWTPAETQTLWGAVSRALRTPDLVEQFARVQVAETPASATEPAVKVVLFGNPNVAPESLTAYELGYRAKPVPSIVVDVSAFYNAYSDLIDLAANRGRFQPTPMPHVLVPRIATNVAGGHSTGAEVTAQWQPTKFWRVAPSYTFLHAPFLSTGFEFDYTHHRANVRSYLDLPAGVELNSFVSYVGALRTRNVPAYTRLDTGVSWRATDSIRVSLWGRNLLGASHLEARETTTALRYVRREAVAQVTWHLGRR